MSTGAPPTGVVRDIIIRALMMSLARGNLLKCHDCHFKKSILSKVQKCQSFQ